MQSEGLRQRAAETLVDTEEQGDRGMKNLKVTASRGMGSRGAGRRLISLGSLLLGLQVAIAPVSAQKYPWNEAENHVTRASEVQSLGTDLFGDQVSLQDGSLSFSVTDIDIRGNNALPVRVSRSYKLFNREHQPPHEMLGDWEIDLPRLSGVFAPHWVGSNGSALTRCSDAGQPPTPRPDPGIEDSVTAHAYWEGIDLQIPGVSSGELLVNKGAGAQPSGGPYPWVTADHFRVSCLASIQNGASTPLRGQGFLAIGPDGTRYWFDWMAQYWLPASRQISGPFDSSFRSITVHGHEWSIPRRRNVLYATRVEDRFGNSVQYKYSNAPDAPGRLTEISSSDGRKIVLSYQGQKIFVTATTSDGSAPRTWTYTESTTPKGRRTLTSVELPDRTRWQLGLSQFTDAEIKYSPRYGDEPVRSCTQLEAPHNADLTPVATVMHPSGAVGTFTTGIHEHGRTNVPLACMNVTDANPVTRSTLGNNPNDDSNIYPISYHLFSLTQKRISGAGVTQGEWNYSYDPSISVFLHPGTTFDWPFCVGAHCHQPPSCSGGPCPGSTRTIVTSPDGKWTRYTYGNSFKYNEGKLLKVETGTSAANILSTETYEYDFAREGRTYPLRLGHSTKSFGGYTDYQRPLTGITKAVQGVAFSWRVAECRSPAEPCLDGFQRPLQVIRSSTLPGNPSRKEGTTYADNLARWVVGQVSEVRCLESIPASSACDGGTATSVMSQTTFDATWALPLVRKEFGRIVEKLTWDTTSDIGSGQRGTLKTVADGRDQVTTLTAWKRGFPTFVRHPATPESPAGAVQTVRVNDAGWVEEMTSEIGALTQFKYDPMGRVTRVTHPAEDPTLGVAWNDTTHDFSLQPAKYGLPTHWRWLTTTGNSRTEIRYDALWRPVVEERYDTANPDTTRVLVVKRYDAVGRLRFQSHPLRTLSDYATVAAGTSFEYDVLGRPTRSEVPSVDGPGGRFTTRTEYLAGFMQRVTSPNLAQTTTRFLAWDEPTTDYPVAIVHPEGAFTDIERDTFGKPSAITRRDASSTLAVTRTYAYNGYQQLCGSVEPETGVTLMGYDAAGNLAWSAAGLPSGTACHASGTTPAIAARRADRAYDARNRLVSLDFPDGNGNQTWDYYADGKPRQITTWNIGVPGADPKETRNLYAYYNRGLLKTELIAVPAWYTFSVEHGYNANGHETSLTYPSGHTVTSTVNALGQPTAISGGGTTYAGGIRYHPNGAVAGFTYGNNIVHAMAQNDRQLPDTVSSIHGGTEFLHDQYDYDGHGNVLAITDARTGAAGRRTRSMGYDGLDRLTSVASPMYGSTGANYSYNVLDDLTSLSIGGAKARSASYRYDASRRLTRVTRTAGGRVAALLLGYDAQGNLASRGDLLTSQQYRFDFGNRLREVEGVERYRYDGHGRRVLAMNFGSGTVLSQYGLDGRLLYQHSDRTGLSTEHVYLGGSLLAIREWPLAGGADTVKYQHTDALGSPVVVTRQDRSIVEETEYEPYGRVLNRPMHDGAGYTGHVEDAATGLVYMQQRYYDPMLGVFLSVDPVTAYSSGDWRQFNRYAYAFNNPYKFTDPDGRMPSCTPNCTLEQADAYTSGQARLVVGALAGSAVVGATAAVTVATGTAAAVGSAVVSTARVVGAKVKEVAGAISTKTTEVSVKAMVAVEGEVALGLSAVGANPATSSAIAAQVATPASAAEFISGAAEAVSGVQTPPSSPMNALGAAVGTEAKNIVEAAKKDFDKVRGQ